MEEHECTSAGPRASDREVRRALTKALCRIFSEWRFTEEEQVLALGLQGTHANNPYSLETGNLIPLDGDVYVRAKYLFSIYKYLHLLYPENRGIQNGWMHSKNNSLGNREPISIISRNTDSGLKLICERLRNSCDLWQRIFNAI